MCVLPNRGTPARVPLDFPPNQAEKRLPSKIHTQYLHWELMRYPASVIVRPEKVFSRTPMCIGVCVCARIFVAFSASKVAVSPLPPRGLVPLCPSAKRQEGSLATGPRHDSACDSFSRAKDAKPDSPKWLRWIRIRPDRK